MRYIVLYIAESARRRIPCVSSVFAGRRGRRPLRVCANLSFWATAKNLTQHKPTVTQSP